MSKILFASMAFDGHFNPLTSLAVHLKERGHDVRWYTGPTYAERLRKLGIPHYPFTRAKDINAFNLSEHFPEYERLAGKKSPKAIAYGVKELFFGQIEPQYRDVCELRANGFEFDAVICDGALYLAHILAEKITPLVYVVMPAPTPAPSTRRRDRNAPPPFFGLQPARTVLGDLRDFIMRELTRPSTKIGMECLNEFRVREGLPRYEANAFDLHANYARALFQIGVPGLEFPRTEWPANFQFIGALLPHKDKARATTPLPEHIAAKVKRFKNVVAVSQGTTDNRDATKLFIPSLEAFARHDEKETLLVVATGGRHTSELRARFPHDNVVIEDWIDFHALLPVTSVFICNGGFGSTLLSLSHGVPLLAAGKLEGKADINARVSYRGAGLDLKTERPTPAQLRDGVARVLHEPRFRERVAALRAEIATYRPIEIIEKKLAEDGIVASEEERVDPLTRLAIHHGTDKFGPHFYTPIYNELFARRRHEPLRMLEIGVGGYGWRTIGGASLAMWAAYFTHARTRIVGLDIAPKQLALAAQDARVVVEQGSQIDAALLERICREHGPFDIIIDDGSHIPAHVVQSFESLFLHMNEGGLYVIEDVQTTFWPQFGGSPVDGGATMSLASSLLHGLHHAEVSVALPSAEATQIAKRVRSVRAFHNLIVVENGANDEPSNFAPASRGANPHTLRARAIIEREIERAPSPGAYASLAMMSVGERDDVCALKILRDGLARFPDDPMLTSIAVDLGSDTRERHAHLQRLAALEGPSSTALVDAARAAIDAGGTAMHASLVAVMPELSSMRFHGEVSK